MPRYYFDTHDGDTAIEDNCGLELQGREDIRRHALAGLGEMAREALPSRDYRNLSVTVFDQQRRVVYRAVLTLSAKWM